MLTHLNSRSSIVHRRSSIVFLTLFTAYVVSGFSRTVNLSRTVSAQQYTFEEVASGLKHKDFSTRLRAIQILKDADYEEAAVPIAATLEDPDDRVQLAAIDAERSLFTTRPVSRRQKIGFVIEKRTSAGGDVAAEGQLALKARDIPTQVLTGLAVALRDNNLRVRGEAINLTLLLAPRACAANNEICSHIGNALIDNVNARNTFLRRASMQALGLVRYSNSVQALLDQFSYYQTGPDAVAALEGLAGIGHPASVSVFRQALANSNADLRRLAIEGLARAGDRDVLSELQQLGQVERSGGVLLALHYASIKLGAAGNSVQQLVVALNTTAQRPLALKYLLDLSPSMAPTLVEFLRDQSPDVRRLMTDVIGFSRDASVITALEAATKDADPDVAIAAKRAIDRIKLE
jgi:HEAT repeat protein